jgi:hypothetical protein
VKVEALIWRFIVAIWCTNPSSSCCPSGTAIAVATTALSPDLSVDSSRAESDGVKGKAAIDDVGVGGMVEGLPLKLVISTAAMPPASTRITIPLTMVGVGRTRRIPLRRPDSW